MNYSQIESDVHVLFVAFLVLNIKMKDIIHIHNFIPAI